MCSRDVKYYLDDFYYRTIKIIAIKLLFYFHEKKKRKKNTVTFYVKKIGRMYARSMVRKIARSKTMVCNLKRYPSVVES